MGEFNQSPDNRRKGRAPHTLQQHLEQASRLLVGRTFLTAWDYQKVLDSVQEGDVVYLDPPYQGVITGKDRRYRYGIQHADFIDSLHRLNDKNIPFLLSYDGKTGVKFFGQPLPMSLQLTLVEVQAGRSSQATLLGREEITVESLYLSPALKSLLGTTLLAPSLPQQLSFWEVGG